MSLRERLEKIAGELESLSGEMPSDELYEELVNNVISSLRYIAEEIEP